MPKSISTIAIDGPVAAGKSTIGHRLSALLGYVYLDTGLLYRAVAAGALLHNAPLDADSLTQIASSLRLVYLSSSAITGSRQCHIRVDDQDVTSMLYRSSVEAIVSSVASIPGVRQALLPLQRQAAKRGHIVMVGRDIGTVVLPDADLKLYLDASVEERARRRYREALAWGIATTYEDVLANIRKRDAQDSSRPIAPLAPAQDAIIVDTTGLSISEVMQTVLSIFQRAKGGQVVRAET